MTRVGLSHCDTVSDGGDVRGGRGSTALGSSPLTRALENFTLPDRPARRDALLGCHLPTDGIPQLGWFVYYLQYGNVGVASNFEATEPILPADNGGGIRSCTWR